MKCYTFVDQKLIEGIEFDEVLDPRRRRLLFSDEEEIRLDYIYPPLVNFNKIHNVQDRRLSNGYYVLSRPFNEENNDGFLLRLFSNEEPELFGRIKTIYSSTLDEGDSLLRLSTDGAIVRVGEKYISIADDNLIIENKNPQEERNIVYWVSRHQYTPEQAEMIKKLHGKFCEIRYFNQYFSSTESLARIIKERSDGFVYAVANIEQFFDALSQRLKFGYIQTEIRGNNTSSVIKVYHAQAGQMTIVYE